MRLKINSLADVSVLLLSSINQAKSKHIKQKRRLESTTTTTHYYYYYYYY